MMMGLGFLGILLVGGVLLALFIGGLAPALRRTGAPPLFRERCQPTARQVLDERFARGEISAEEYEVIRARIEG